MTSRSPCEMPNIDSADTGIPPQDDNGISTEPEVNSEEELEVEGDKLHQYIKEDNLSDIEYLTDIYKSKLYLNSAGESALFTAIKYKRFEIYVFLKSIGLKFKSKREEEVIYELTSGDKAILNKLMLQKFPHSEDDHVLYILSKSRSISFVENFDKRIEQIYRYLDAIPEVSIFLKILHSVDNLDIVFDFESDIIKSTDPAPNYKNGEIFITAKEEQMILGLLAYELAFVSLYILFNNYNQTFSKIDNIQGRWEEIITIEEKNNICNDNEYKLKPFVSRSSNYTKHEQIYAYLARVPQILAQYSTTGREMLATEPFKTLLNYYNDQKEGGLSYLCKEFIQSNYLINPKNTIETLNKRLGNVHGVIKHGIRFTNQIYLDDFVQSKNQVLLVETESTLFSILRIYESLIMKNKNFSLQDTLFIEFNIYLSEQDKINKVFYSPASKILCLSISQNSPKNKMASVLRSLKPILQRNLRKRIILILQESEMESLGFIENLFSDNYILAAKHQFSFNDFTIESQHNILKHEIIFQGEQIHLSKLIDITDDKAKEAIDTNTLVHIIMGTRIKIGQRPPDASHLEGAYSKMYEEVDMETFVSKLLCSKSNNFYIISGISGSLEPEITESLIQHLNYKIQDSKKKIEVNDLLCRLEILNKRVDSKSLRARIQVTDNQFKEKDFIQFCRNNSTSKIYWIHQSKENDEYKFVLQQIYNPNFYIRGKRFNREVMMDKKIIDELCSTTLTDIYIISTKHEKNVIDWLNATDMQASVFSRNTQHRKIQLVSSQDNGEYCFKNEQATSDRTVHLLTFEQDQLFWKKSYGSLSNISKYRATDYKKKQVLIDEDHVIKEIEENKVAIISGDPGTGKSTTLVYLTNAFASQSTTEERLTKSHWVINVNLKQNYRAINALHLFQRDISDEKIKDKISTFLMQLNININNDVTNDFVQALLRIRLGKANLWKPLLIIFDGFDEVIDKENKLKIISLFKILLDKTCVKFCITTRPNYQSDLEGALSTFALKLEPMDEVMTRIFVSKSLQNYLSLKISDDKSADIFDSNGEKMLKLTDGLLSNLQIAFKSQGNQSTPLQLYLMFEASAGRFQEWTSKNIKFDNLDLNFFICNIWEVYTYFVDRKIDILCKQIVVREMGQKKEIKDHLENYHIDLAKVLLNMKPSIKECLKHSQDIVLSVGVVKSDGSNIDFIHQTFAEYYAAKKIIHWIGKWNKRINSEFTNFQKMQYFCTKILREIDFQVIRAFLNVEFQEKRTKNARLREQYYDIDIICLAAKENHVGIARFVFDNFPDVNVNVADSRGYTALDTAVKCGHKNMIEWLIENGADVNVLAKDGQSVLHRAAAHGKLDIIRWLVENGADINAQNKEGQTVMHAVAASGHLDLGKWLAERGANVTIVDNNGQSVLHFATVSIFGNIEMVEWLITKGADIKVVASEGQSVLLRAAENGKFDIVKLLVENGANINMTGYKDLTVLHYAVSDSEHGNLETVQWLVEKGANIQAVTMNGRTVLKLAILNGQTEIAEWLLENGADVDHRVWSILNYFGPEIKPSSMSHVVKWLIERGADVNAVDPLGYSVLYSTIDKYGNLEMVKCLVSNGAEIKAAAKDGKTVLHAAVHSGYSDIAIWLVENGADVSVGDNCGLTALHYAVIHRQSFRPSLSVHCILDIVQWLVTNGADLKAVTKDGKTVLHYAVQDGEFEIVKWLVERRADVNVSDNKGFTALHYAVCKDDNLQTIEWLVTNGADMKAVTKDGKTVLHYAVQDGMFKTVKLLVERGADINVGDNNGFTALHYAVCKDDNLQTIEWLVTNGADMKAVTKDGKTVLHYAVQNEKFDIVKYLIESGADINVGDNNGFTALHYAVFKNDNLQTIEWLVTNGADMKAVTKDGKTVLHYAVQNEKFDIVKYLIESGADINVGDSNGFTALHYAVCKHYNLKTIEWLVTNGADMKAVTKDGTTVLHYAVHSGYSDIAIWLVENGADVNEGDNCGLTALHYAVIHRQSLRPSLSVHCILDIVQWLVTNGADLKAVTKDGKTVLHYAVQAGELEIVKYLKESGADINVGDNIGTTALHYAVFKYDNFKTVEWLVTNGADMKAITKNGTTVLHYAVKHGMFETVKFLVKRGADVNVGDNNGLTALHYAVYLEQSIFLRRSVPYILKIVQWLVTNRADMKAITKDGKTVLHYAVQHGEFEIVKYLKESGADINFGDNDGFTALHYAVCKDDNLQTVEWLVTNGADMKAVTKDGKTVLHYAAQNEKFDIVKYLKESGADINVGDNNGFTALHYAVCKHHNLKTIEWLVTNGADMKAVTKDGKTVLHNAVQDGMFKTVQLLVERGADVNVSDNKGFTALHYAVCKDDNLQTVEWLVKNGADVKAVTTDGKTVLHYAVQDGMFKTVKLLVERGADVNVSDNKGFTALHYAVCKDDNLQTVEWLVTNGADLKAVTKDGKTILHYAVQDGMFKTVKLLVERGADVNVSDSKGFTALHYAVCKDDNLQTVEWLVTNGADLKAVTKDGKTILHYAVKHRMFETVKFLVKRGADVNVGDNNGFTALHYAVYQEQPFFFRRSVPYKLKIVQWLVTNRADIKAITKDGKTVLHYAVQDGEFEIVKYLTESGADINAVTKNGETVLHSAANFRHLNIVKWLVERGADINAKGFLGFTVLHDAAAYGRLEIVKWLIENGAKADAVNIFGHTALDVGAKHEDIVQWLNEHKRLS